MGVRTVGGDPRGVQHGLVVAKLSRFWSERLYLRGVEPPGFLCIEERVFGPREGWRKQAQEAEHEEDAE